jgi:hypothetical protein
MVAPCEYTLKLGKNELINFFEKTRKNVLAGIALLYTVKCLGWKVCRIYAI